MVLDSCPTMAVLRITDLSNCTVVLSNILATIWLTSISQTRLSHFFFVKWLFVFFILNKGNQPYESSFMQARHKRLLKNWFCDAYQPHNYWYQMVKMFISQKNSQKKKIDRVTTIILDLIDYKRHCDMWYNSVYGTLMLRQKERVHMSVEIFVADCRM